MFHKSFVSANSHDKMHLKSLITVMCNDKKALSSIYEKSVIK